jgi:hypothetical protein
VNIEAGKYYKTRDGRKVFVCADALPNPFGQSIPWVLAGYIDGGRIACTYGWKSDGTAHDGSHYDLVAEWHEPATEERVVWLVRFGNGDLCTFCLQDDHQAPSSTGTVIGSTRVTVTEGVFA